MNIVESILKPIVAKAYDNLSNGAVIPHENKAGYVFLSQVFCNEIRECIETCAQIRRKINVSVDEIPDASILMFGVSIISSYIDRRVVVNGVARYDKNIIENISKQNQIMAYQMYHIIREALSEERIQRSIRNKDEKFFIKELDDLLKRFNIEELFNKYGAGIDPSILQGIKFETIILPFKNFMMCKEVKPEYKDLLWDYLHNFLNMINKESVIVQKAKQ